MGGRPAPRVGGARRPGEADPFRRVFPGAKGAQKRRQVSSPGPGREPALLDPTPFLSRLQHWLQRTRDTTARPVRATGLPTIEWSPDGQRILTAGCDDTARIWDPL